MNEADIENPITGVPLGKSTNTRVTVNTNLSQLALEAVGVGSQLGEVEKLNRLQKIVCVLELAMSILPMCLNSVRYCRAGRRDQPEI